MTTYVFCFFLLTGPTQHTWICLILFCELTERKSLFCWRHFLSKRDRFTTVTCALSEGSFSIAWYLFSLYFMRRTWTYSMWVTSGSYLMQFSGSCVQSVLHINLSQCSQPMVGFSARPLSRASAAGLLTASSRRANTPANMSDQKLDTHFPQTT